MRTPNDYLRALLLELAAERDLTDAAIARAHNRAHDDSTLASTTVYRFRAEQPAQGTPPSQLMEEAYAVATGTTREGNWEEAFRRWREAMGSEAEYSLRRRSA